MKEKPVKHYRAVYRAGRAARHSLGFEDEDLKKFQRLVGRYCSYLLPKQAGGTSQIRIFKTLRMTSRPALYTLTRPWQIARVAKIVVPGI